MGNLRPKKGAEMELIIGVLVIAILVVVLVRIA
jgi:hypothetical protein